MYIFFCTSFMFLIDQYIVNDRVPVKCANKSKLMLMHIITLPLVANFLMQV